MQRMSVVELKEAFAPFTLLSKVCSMENYTVKRNIQKGIHHTLSCDNITAII